MRKLILLTLLLSNLALRPQNANASGGDALGAAVAAMAVTGTIYTINSFQYDEWLKSEMESWKYDETDLTTSLSRTCDLNLELRLHRNRRMSYIVFVIHNQKSEPISISTSDIEATYSNGAVRKLKSTGVVSDIKVDPGWTIQGAYPISEKTELADTDYIDVRVPTLSADGKTGCDLKGRLNKNKNRVAEYIDYHRLLSVELGFFYGNNLFSSSSLKSSADKQGLFGFIMNAYFYKNIGFTLGFLRQDLKNNNAPVVKSAKGITSDLKLWETDMLIGLATNFLYERKYSFSANGGVLAHTLGNSSDQNSHIEEKVGMYLNANANYIFYSSDYRPFAGDYMVGLGLLGKYIPKYTIGTVQFGGTSIAPYVNFNIGF